MVLDTNVVLDWLVFGDAAVLPLADALASGRLRWLATERTQAELAHVLRRGAFGRWSPDTDRVLGLVTTHATLTGAAPPCGLVCADADDQMFIDLALAQQAHWLVTRDRALLRLARPAQARGTCVCTPAAWRWPMRTALAELSDPERRHT